MAALPYMQLYVADYLADTQHLTTEEHGAYMLLIFSYWQTGKPLKIDRLQTLSRTFNERWPSVKDTLSEFFIERDGVWIHKRIEAELEKVLSKSVKASDAGKASALARAIKKQSEINGRSTNVQTNVPTDRSTERQRKGNHTDTDTDTDTDTNKYTLKHFKEALLSAGAESMYVETWVAIRKKKKATNSEIALNAFMKQASLSNLSVNDCLKLCCENSWSGFKAEWVLKDKISNSGFSKITQKNIENTQGDW